MKKTKDEPVKLSRVKESIKVLLLLGVFFLAREYPVNDTGRMDYEVRAMNDYFSDPDRYRGKEYTGKEARETIDGIRDAVKAYYKDHPKMAEVISPYEAFQMLMLKAHHESHFMHWPDPNSDEGRKSKATDPQALYHYGPYHHSKRLWGSNFTRFAPPPRGWKIWRPRNKVADVEVEIIETAKGPRADFNGNEEEKARFHAMRASAFYTSYVNLGYMLEEVIPELKTHFAAKGHDDVRIGAISLYLEHVVGISDAKKAITATLSDADKYDIEKLRIAASTVRGNKPLFTHNGRPVAVDEVFYQIWKAMDDYEALRYDVYGEKYIPFFQRPQDRPGFLGRVARYLNKRVLVHVASNDKHAIPDSPRVKPEKDKPDTPRLKPPRPA